MKKGFAARHMKNRIIAFIMAMLLAFTPMYSSVGEGGGVKADEANDGNTVGEDLVTANFNMIIETIPAWVNWNNELVATPNSSGNMKVYYVPGVQKVNMSFSVSDKYLVDIKVDKLYIAGQDSSTKEIDVRNLGSNNYVQVYADVSASGASTQKLTGVDVAYVELQQSTDDISNAKWAENSENSLTVDGVVEQEVGYNESDFSTTYRAGCIKYGYAKAKKASDGTYLTAYTDYEKESSDYKITWGNSMLESVDDGVYVGFVAFFADDKDTTPISSEGCIKSLGEKIIDTNAPSISECTVKYDGTIISSDKYIESLDKTLEISATVDDVAVDTVKLVKKKKTTDTSESKYEDVKTLSLKENSENVYTCELNDFMDEAYEYYIFATDTKEQENVSSELPRVLEFDSNVCEISELKWKDDSTSESTSKNARTFTFNVKTAKKLQGDGEAVDILDSSDNPYKNVSIEGEINKEPTENECGYYEYSFNVTVPSGDSSANYYFNNMQLQINFDDSLSNPVKESLASLSGFLYDNTTPTVDYGNWSSYFLEEEPDSAEDVNWIGKNTVVNEGKENEETVKKSTDASSGDTQIILGGITISSGNSDIVESALNLNADSVTLPDFDYSSDTSNNATKKTGTLTLSEGSKIENGKVAVTWKVSDAAGNTLDKTSYAYVDLTDPVCEFTSLSSTLTNGVTKTYTIQNYKDKEVMYVDAQKASSLTLEVDDELSGISKVVFKAVDADNKDKNSYTVTKENITDKTLTVDLSDIIGTVAADTEEEYTITASAYDKAGNVSEISFKVLYDNKAPEISSVDLVKKSDTETAWTEVSSTEVADNTYYINNSEGQNSDKYNYAYKVVIRDANIDTSDITKIISLTNDIDGLVTTTGCTVVQDKDSDGNIIPSQYVCYLNVDKSKLSKELAAGVQVSSTDAAGHEGAINSKLNPIKLRAVDTSISISGIKVIETASESEVTDKDSLSTGTNKSYKIQATIEGPCKFKSIELIGGTDTVATVSSIEKNSNGDFGEELNNVTKRYTTKFTFDVPVPDTKGIMPKVAYYSSLKIKVTDLDAKEDTAPTTTDSIVTLLYDSNPPVVTFEATDNNSNHLTGIVASSASDKTWVKSASVGITVSSGQTLEKNDTTESALDNVYYTLNGTTTNISPDSTDATKAKATVSLTTSSASVDGTTIQVSATDKAGNKTSSNNTDYYSATYYIDNASPDIKALKVGGKDGEGLNFNGNPVISFTVGDNLTLKDVKTSVTCDGKALKTSSLLDSAIEKENLSESFTKSINTLVGDNAADGLYKVTVTVTDKAGNEAEKSIEFRLDNSEPVITVTAADKDKNSVAQKKWVNNANVKIDVISGSTDSQSDIAEATYEISGGTSGNDKKNLTLGTDKTTASASNVELPESKTTDGTKVTVYAKDESGNDTEESYIYYVDASAPKISGLTADGKAENIVPLAKNPEIKFNVGDNLTLAEVNVAVAYNGGESKLVKTETGALEASKTNSYKYALTELAGKAEGSAYAADGDYTITITAKDKAGNEAERQTITFRLDNTAPVVTAEVIEGSLSSKHLNSDASDVYYNSDVKVKFTVKDVNISLDELNALADDSKISAVIKDAAADTFSDAGVEEDLVKKLEWKATDTANTYQATVTFTKEQWHNISIRITDKSGNVSAVSKLKFDVDKTNPEMSGITLNGSSYTESAGIIYLDKTAELTFETSDINNDAKDFNLTVTKRVPDGKGGYSAAKTTTTVEGSEEKVTESGLLVGYVYSFTYEEEGEYEITAYTVDLAGNKSAEGTVKFVVDKTKPAAPTVVLQQNIGTVDAPNWVDYTGCYIDTSKHYNYRYKITGVKDGNGPNLDETTAANTVKVASGSLWSSNSRGEVVKSADGSYYTYAFNESDRANINALASGETYQNYVVVKDRSGNEISVALTPLKKMNLTINFGTAQLKNSAGTTKLFGDTNLAVNDTYKLYITVESGYQLSRENVILRKSDATGDTEFALNKATTFETGYEEDGRYTSNLVFDIPGTVLGGAANINEIYNSMTLYVTDGGYYGKSITLGRLIYDNSRPYVNVLEYSKAAWVKAADAKLTYEVVSGSNSVESIISSASYTLAGSTVDITPASASTTGQRSIMMPESTDPRVGTTITFTATDNAGNVLTTLNGTKPDSVTMFVDGHNPEVSALSIDGLTSFDKPLAGTPTISTSFGDNLALDRVEVAVTYPDGTTKTSTRSYGAGEGLGVNISDTYSFQVDSADGNAADGSYQVMVTAYDKAGNVSTAKTIAFTVDNTVPVVDLAISAGTQGGKQPREDGTDYYYRSDVTISFAVIDVNFNTSGVIVTDKYGNSDAEPISVTWSRVGDMYVAAASISAEGNHIISIDAADMTGNKAVGKSISFCVDKTAPTVSLTLDGLSYDESRGIVYLTSDASVTAAIADMTEDAGDLNIQIVETKPDTSAGNPSYIKTENRSFSFSDEADYTVNFYAVDMAGNQSATRTVTFRVDKTIPDLSISGMPGGGTTANATAITFTMNEAFWWDATGQITIYRKAGDGQEEALYKTIELNPTAFSSAVTENLTETGVYRFEFTGTDKVGHTIETSQSFTIDRDAPVVTLQGVMNYYTTDKSVTFTATIVDDFYTSKSILLNGTMVDADGKKHILDFGLYNQGGNPTVINKEFTEDGIYDIEVTSTDAAGNSHSSKVHFTIDKTAPKIGDLSAYDGTILKEFNWDMDLDDLVSDLTVCDVHMYLNGSEYDGVSDIEDGAYTLLITAEDEIGHTVEKSVSFVLDTKAPVFIVTGVENGEVKNEQYNIGVSLQLSEDTLTDVTLNGSPVEITDNAANLTVDSKGDYILTMNAVDEAGNEAHQQIRFTYGEEKSRWWLWLIAAAGAAAVGFFVFILAKRKRDNEE